MLEDFMVLGGWGWGRDSCAKAGLVWFELPGAPRLSFLPGEIQGRKGRQRPLEGIADKSTKLLLEMLISEDIKKQ